MVAVKSATTEGKDLATSSCSVGSATTSKRHAGLQSREESKGV